MRKALLGVALLAAPVAASAADQTKEDQTEKKICRALFETGSRMPHGKECRTRAEWTEVDKARQDYANKLINDVTAGRAGGGGASMGVSSGMPR